ncbi:P-type cation-transporting ATPase [Blastocladiella britannica]|nr:P-type cation-transporting ATPase [Blastocladiella britannica]
MSEKAPKKKQTSVAIDEHKLSFEELTQKYDTLIDTENPAKSGGLNTEDAARRLATDGPNVMAPPKRKSPIMRFVECILALFNLLLIIAGVLSFLLYALNTSVNQVSLYTGIIFILVAFMNAGIEFVQISKAESAMMAFLNMIPAKATAVRGGQLINLPAQDLVKGDIVYVRMGDKLPADIRIIKASDMKVDNSSLTGEAEPQLRLVNSTHDNPLEAENLAFNSTLVVSGEGFGVVVRCGDDTVIGQIANMTNSEKKRTSPMTAEIDFLVKFISSLAIGSGVIFFIIAMVIYKDLKTAFQVGIGVLTAWVPEGLYGTVTMLLTFAAQRMATQQVLVKQLTGVETLGAVTLLATDKTGTLTRNQMTVSIVWTHLTKWVIGGNASSLAAGESPFDSSVKGTQEIMNISALCTRARFNKTDVPMDQREIIGDATETGLLRLATQKLREFDSLSDRFPKVLDVPFNSDNKWAMTIHKMAHADGHFTQYMKGAPERVLKLCTSIVGPTGETIPLSEEHRKAFDEAYEYMASKGHRVLAFAKFEMDGTTYPESYVFNKEEKNFPMSGLTFVGLASLEDPPKHGVREAIGHCRRAGIKVVMVTGDHPLTAEAIARKINLVLTDTREGMAKKRGVPTEEVPEEDARAIVIHGERVDKLTDAEWDMIFSKEEIVFARTSPKNKLQIVKKAQSLGHIVGVTGDGVNDSPALKKADLGISMNISGSDVSKEAAAMILLDDNFASIINGIREGRLIFANLKKSIKYVLTHTMPEVIPQLLFVAVPLPVGIGALQILAIDLGFELFAALSFAFELPESEGLMKLQPRRPVDSDTIEHLRARRAFDRKFMSVATNEDGADDERELTNAERFRQLLSPEYWTRWAFAGNDGDVLVDLNTIVWAYLEVGILEYIGAQIVYFVVFYFYAADGVNYYITPTDLYNGQNASTAGWGANGAPPFTLHNGLVISVDDQAESLARAQSSVYFAIFMGQIGNLFACKTSMTSPLRAFSFKNMATYKALFGGLCVTILIIWVPGISSAFGSSIRTNPLYLLIGLANGVLIYLYSGLRFWLRQRFVPIKYNPEPLGLQMHATRYSNI